MQKSFLFTNIFEKYFAPFCVYAISFVKDREVAKDIVSDVFVSMWIRKDEIDFDSKLIVAYIKTAVRNKAINYLIQLKTEETYKETIIKSDRPEAALSNQIHTTTELHELLQASLKKLPSNYREVFIKKYLEGKKNIEIAQELNLSTKSIERYNQKILAFLREELKDYQFLLFIHLYLLTHIN